MPKKPSVTDLLDLLSKPALISWANKLGLQGIDVKKKRKASLSAGTSIHAQIESGCFEREIDAMSFAEFLKGREILAVEQEIETEWFVGRYDCLLKNGREEYIVDYKRGFKGKVYLEHKLQLIAYTMARPAKMAIVPVPQFHLVPIEIQDRRPYEQMLIHLSAIWNLKKEIENAQVPSL